MKYNREILLKDGTKCTLRNPTGTDAAAILQNLIQTSGETDYMARYADEIRMSEEQEREFLLKLEADPKELMIAAFIDGQLVANEGISPASAYERFRHRAVFGISIKKAYWGKGLGSAMLESMIAASRDMGYEQIELEVAAPNERAIALYRKAGFEIYGTRERSFKYRDGSYAAEHLMVLDLQRCGI